MKFPAHVLKTIKKIDLKKYDSGICILRGGLPYVMLFEAAGWKIHFVLCGRKNEKVAPTMFRLRYNGKVDKTLKKVQGGKVLLIENNSYNGNTSRKVALELKKSFGIQKPDLFLDYYLEHDFLIKKFGKMTFLKWNKKLQRDFGKIYCAEENKVEKWEKKTLVDWFIKKLE